MDEKIIELLKEVAFIMPLEKSQMVTLTVTFADGSPDIVVNQFIQQGQTVVLATGRFQ